jgi:hypothetical protein
MTDDPDLLSNDQIQRPVIGGSRSATGGAA